MRSFDMTRQAWDFFDGRSAAEKAEIKACIVELMAADAYPEDSEPVGDSGLYRTKSERFLILFRLHPEILQISYLDRFGIWY